MLGETGQILLILALLAALLQSVLPLLGAQRNLPSLIAVELEAAAVEGGSLACLSCHDGTLALGAIRTNPYWANNKTYQDGVSVTGHVDLVTGQFLTNAYGYVGTDLTNDHPISITYQNDLDTDLKDPSGFVGVKLFGAGGNVTGNSVECGSCHNPHNYGTTGTTAPFLRASMAASALCLQCHTK